MDNLAEAVSSLDAEVEMFKGEVARLCDAIEKANRIAVAGNGK